MFGFFKSCCHLWIVSSLNNKYITMFLYMIRYQKRVLVLHVVTAACMATVGYNLISQYNRKITFEPPFSQVVTSLMAPS